MERGAIMTLKDLKIAITQRTLSNNFLILKNAENPIKDSNAAFLSEQYLVEISKARNLEIEPVNSIYEPLQSTLSLLLPQKKLSVVRVDIFEETSLDYSQFVDTVVICNKVDSKIAPVLTDFIVEIPKLETWHIEDYAKSLVPEVAPANLLWLIKATDHKIHRILNEIDKAKLFSPNEHDMILKALRNECYSDLYRNFDLEKELDIRDFSAQAVAQAIVNKNMSQVSYFFLRRQFFAFDVNLLNYWLLKYLVDRVPTTFAADQAKLIDKIEFVSSLSIKIRKGELELSNSSLFDYIALKLLTQ
jgi:hypothetical protein